MPEFRNVGLHAVEVKVGDARVPLEPGGFVTMSSEDAKDEYNQSLELMAIDEKAKGGSDK